MLDNTENKTSYIDETPTQTQTKESWGCFDALFLFYFFKSIGKCETWTTLPFNDTVCLLAETFAENLSEFKEMEINGKWIK